MSAAKRLHDDIKFAVAYLDSCRSRRPEAKLPPDRIADAFGIAFIIQEKAGVIIGGSASHGFIIARLNRGQKDARWSAPSALDLGGLTIGLQFGLQTVHSILVLQTQEALDKFIEQSRLQVGINAGYSALEKGNDVDRGLEKKGLHSNHGVYAVTQAEGVYLGISLEGLVAKADSHTNKAFYGEQLTPKELLVEGKGLEVADKKAKALYETLDSFVSQERSGKK